MAWEGDVGLEISGCGKGYGEEGGEDECELHDCLLWCLSDGLEYME
jgi:hypothetical protein